MGVVLRFECDFQRKTLSRRSEKPQRLSQHVHDLVAAVVSIKSEAPQFLLNLGIEGAKTKERDRAKLGMQLNVQVALCHTKDGLKYAVSCYQDGLLLNKSGKSRQRERMRWRRGSF